MIIDFAQDIGTRDYQEDRFVVQATKEGFAAHVLDGHGPDGQGDECSSCAAICLESDVLPRFDIKTENEEIVRGLQNITSRYDKTGSTLSSIYCFSGQGYASILGDSPVWYIKGDEIFGLPIQDINNKKELALRKKAGAKLRKDYPAHIFNENGQGLSTLGSLGDNSWGNIIRREPNFFEIKEFDHLIVASDGLKLPPNEIVREFTFGAQNLIEKNLKYLSENKIYSVDNCTIVIYSK